MFILKKNDICDFDRSKAVEFVNYWSSLYKYSVKKEDLSGMIDYITELNIGKTLTEENIKHLLRWKDTRLLSAIVKSGPDVGKENKRVKSILGIQNELNNFRLN